MGFIFITLFVPLLTAFVLYLLPTWPIKDKTNRKKFVVLVLTSLVIGSLSSSLLYLGAIQKQYANEVWNFRIKSIQHEERWSEKEMRTRQVSCGTDSKGRTKYRTETYYVTAYYGPYWKARDEFGDEHSINSVVYNKWKVIWANEKRTGEHRGSATGFKSAVTGGIFKCSWGGEFEKMYPHSTFHRYKNKLRASDSIFKFKEPSEALIKKYPRPADKNNNCPVFGYGATVDANDLMLLRRVNGHLGAKKQIHSILMLFNSNDMGVVDDVLSAWQGTNKNELVTFIGIKDGNVQWCSAQSWMDNTELHKSIETVLIGNQWNVKMYADALLENVPKYWDRKEFKDFDYIKVSIHWGWLFGQFILCVVVNIVLFFILENKMPIPTTYMSLLNKR